MVWERRRGRQRGSGSVQRLGAQRKRQPELALIQNEGRRKSLQVLAGSRTHAQGSTDATAAQV